MLCLLTILPAVVAATAAKAEPLELPSFFGSLEARASNLAPFRKWQSVLARANAESVLLDIKEGSCEDPNSPQCLYRAWLRFLDGLRGIDRWRQLVAINQEINRRDYIPDRVNWGLEDYWQSPGEFLTRFGDCEDFAIIKFLSLKRLGWPDEALRLAAVRDTELDMGHAVLIAYLNGRTWMLDNQIQAVTDTEHIQKYRPVFSINEGAWWRHRAPDGTTTLAGTGGSDRTAKQ